MGLNWQNKMAVGQILLLKKMYVEEPSHKHTNSIMYIYLWNLEREGRIFIMKFEKKNSEIFNNSSFKKHHGNKKI